MEEEKAAAYYDELTRKGANAARFKQGLGFSSSSVETKQNDDVPSRGSALPSSSSFLSSFVKGSNLVDGKKEIDIGSIQNKLKKKPKLKDRGLDDKDRDRDRDRDRDSWRRRSRSRDRDRERERSSTRRRSRSRDRERERNSTRGRSSSRDRERERNSRRRRSKSRDRDVEREKSSMRYRSRSRDRDGERERSSTRCRSRSRDRERNSRRRDSGSRERERGRRKRSRSVSPRGRRLEKEEDRKSGKEKSERVEYAKLIQGYDKMSPADRVKAKMKLQLSATAKLDEANGMGSGWERFNFDKDAPLDDEEIEAAEDDGALVKHIGQTFRFSAVEARREEKIKATHDEAIFGTSSLVPPADTDSEADNCTRESPEPAPVASLISDQVRSLQQGSWRDRIHKG